jgi:hypothetical protein
MTCLPNNNMVFTNERMLVETFVARLAGKSSPWGRLQLAREFYYQSGRTDVIGRMKDDSLVAVEAKLTDWRTALHQAFRNRCYAEWSYVLLPEKTARLAHRFTGEFDRRQVGICYLAGSKVVVLHSARRSEPLQPWISLRARQHIDSSGVKSGHAH